MARATTLAPRRRVGALNWLFRLLASCAQQCALLCGTARLPVLGASGTAGGHWATGMAVLQVPQRCRYLQGGNPTAAYPSNAVAQLWSAYCSPNFNDTHSPVCRCDSPVTSTQHKRPVPRCAAHAHAIPTRMDADVVCYHVSTLCCCAAVLCAPLPFVRRLHTHTPPRLWAACVLV